MSLSSEVISGSKQPPEDSSDILSRIEFFFELDPSIQQLHINDNALNQKIDEMLSKYQSKPEIVSPEPGMVK